LEDTSNRLVDNAVRDGARVVAYACSFVPEPLLSVDGLVAQRLRAPGVAGTPMADTYLSSVLCSYVRSILELALEGRFEHVDAWIFASSCDHARRLYDNLDYLDEGASCHIVDVPHRRGDEATAWYERELSELAGALSAALDVDMGADALRRSIARHNRTAGLLRRLADLRRRERPPLRGADVLQLVTAASCAPKAALEAELEALLSRLEEAEGPAPRARLMLVGSALDDPGYVEVIESMGAVVVADRHCCGTDPGLRPIPEDGDPLAVLARHSLEETRCPRMMEDFEQRVAEILATARDSRADGVVVETMKFCDLWGVESSPLVAALREADLPVLRLEREYVLGAEGQLRTRVQAFLESIGR